MTRVIVGLKPSKQSRHAPRMRRLTGCLLAILAGAVVLAGSPAGAASLTALDRSLYRQAFALAEDGQWDEAHAVARRAGEPLPAKVLRWLDMLREGSGIGFEEKAAFLDRNPDWPSTQGLRYQAERVMSAGLEPRRVIAWFGDEGPVSSFGATRLAEAYLATGRQSEAASLVRRFWVDADLSEGEAEAFRDRFRSLLRREDHVRRLDRLVWDYERSQAQRMLPLVDQGHQALAQARLTLRAMEPGVDAAIARVPANLADDPGLAYERLRWRRRKDRDYDTLEFLDRPPRELGRPDKWWVERHIIARRFLERRDYRRVYGLARDHGQVEAFPISQAEFLAGWMALRRLGQPGTARRHFERLYDAVSSPVSKARGAYWLGRAEAGARNPRGARRWYEEAAQHGTTFYGQLAAVELDDRARATLPPEPNPDRSDRAAFEDREMVRIVRMLHDLDPRDRKGYTARFYRELSRTVTAPEDFLLTTELGRDIGRQELAVYAAKRAIFNGIALVPAGYPRLRLPPESRVEDALVLALIRQESTFHPTIVSPAGARGLMQLMPATARRVAGQLGLSGHSTGRLTADPQYNLRLGTTYLGSMVERFRGSYVLSVAAYNAGPARVSRWIGEFGDPRGRPVERVVDWIETIPFYETRNYVQRVLEALQVYRAVLTPDGTRTIERDMM